MKTEKFFDILLNFGADWSVTEVVTSLETNEVDIFLEYCGAAKVYDFAPSRRWRHLDTMQYKSFINARVPRVQWARGEVETLSVPWAEKHERHTILFECKVIDLLLATQNQTQTARLMGCKFDVVNRILHRASERGMARRKEGGEQFKHLSIDEKSFQKGHNYASVLSDPQSERVLEVVAGRTKAACRELMQERLTAQQREQVESISMDLWPAFISTAQEQFPQARIVHDKFHLIKYLNQAIDKVRRREVKGHHLLKDSRYALLKNPDNLTARQKIKFDEITQANLQVSVAWQARENFKAAFENAELPHSRAIYQHWHQAVLQSGIKEVIKVAQMFAKHLDGVLQAMTCNLSNARAERLNGKIQLLKSIARGYRKFDNFRSAILFFNGKLNLYPLNYR